MGNQSPLRVALFVGHKGPGTGAVYESWDEYELAQRAAIAIGATLMLHGHQPFVLGGEGTDYIEQRARLAKLCRPHVALPCHFNAPALKADGTINPQPNGCQVMYHPEDERGKTLAAILATAISRETGVTMRHPEDYGTVPRRGLKILKYMLADEIPTAYLEPLFITNPGDREILGGAGYFADLARAVVDGLEMWRATRGRA